MKARNHAGFTITELLVVVGIIVVLAALALPMINAGLYRARVAHTVSSLRQVGMANTNYSMENNNQICGLGKQTMPRFGRPTSYEGVMWQIAAYTGVEVTGGEGSRLTWSDVVRALEPLHHPHLDKSITSGPNASRWSVAINTAFSHWPGKDENGERIQSVFPRMSEVDNPSSTIYACSGIWSVDAERARDPEFLKLPEGKTRGGPYFTKHRQLPVVFLDGSAGLESFPLREALFDLKYESY